VSALNAGKQRGCRKIREALTETSVFLFLYWTNFSEGGGCTTKGGREGSFQVPGDSSRNSLQTTSPLDFTVASRRRYKIQIR
jgi:hypothetical protein